MKWLLPFLMLAQGLGFAQAARPAQKKASTAAPSRWPIEAIVVEGNHSYTHDQVVAITGLKVGQIAGRPEFDAARDRLTASGAFDTVSYQFTGGADGHRYIATFTVTEYEQVYPVQFDDLHVSERDLTATLKAKEPLFAQGKLPATQPVMQRFTKLVQEYLAAKGIQEKIVGAVEPGPPGEYVISFHPDRPLPVVAQVKFLGNQVITQAVLQDAAQSVAVGMPYTEDRFREVLNASVRSLYEARGRLRVTFPSIKTEPNKDVTGLNLTVTVDEGETYKLAAVKVEEPTPVKADDLLRAGDFKLNELANFDQIGEAVERVKKALRHAGYMKAQVTPRRTLDDEKRTVSLTLWVDGGAQFIMRKLAIAGLDLDGEAEIERLWTLKAGKPFDPDYPDFFVKRIQEQGLFDNLGKAKAEYKINEQDHTADVTLTFAGATAPSGRGGRGRGGQVY